MIRIITPTEINMKLLKNVLTSSPSSVLLDYFICITVALTQKQHFTVEFQLICRILYPVGSFLRCDLYDHRSFTNLNLKL